MIDWKVFLQRLRAFAKGANILNSPCSQARISKEAARLGEMPRDLGRMLQEFNGAELFIEAIPLVTLFGLSQRGDPPASDWFIDRYTPKWRTATKRQGDWVIGMTNYGGLIILDQESNVQEWDISQRKWTPDRDSFANWIERLILDGASYLNEM